MAGPISIARGDEVMAESSEHPRPRPPVHPGDPLPRITYQSPFDEKLTQPVEPPRSKKKRANKGSKEEEEKEEKGGAVGETPALETYEGRRLVRIVVGSVGTLVLLLIGLIIYRTFRNPDEAGASAD